MDFSVQVKHTLFSIIDEMNDHRWLFTKTPGKDFSREKNGDFYEMIKFMISMESRSLKDELLHYFDFDVNTPSNSSFNQRRSRILPEAFEFLFHEFNDRFPESRFWHGLQLIACDGSDLNIYRNPDDPDNYFPNGSDNKGFSQIHLNALYDLCTRRYVDAVIQPGIRNNECRAMVTMIDRYAGEPSTVFIADRGYESYNVFAHALEFQSLLRLNMLLI